MVRVPATNSPWSEARLTRDPPCPSEVTPAGVVAGTVVEILLVLIALGLALCVAVLGSSSEDVCCAALGVGFPPAGTLW